MKQRLVNLINESISEYARTTLSNEDVVEDLSERLLKKGVIVPPCKVGDMVYKVSFVHKTVTSLKVEGFICNLASWKVHCTHLVPSWIGNQKEHIYISFSSFGKNAFLECKEAEQALKERFNNETNSSI